MGIVSRYDCAGLRLDLLEGRRVLVVKATQVEARSAFRRFVGSMPPEEISKVHLANGREQMVGRAGGSARFVSAVAGGQAQRGMSADVVVVDEHTVRAHDLRDDLLFVIAGSSCVDPIVCQ